MRAVVTFTILALVAAASAVTAAEPELMGRVEAVYHEGVMTFNVEHPEAVSASIRVYDLESDALLYDSGPRATTSVTWPAGHELKGAYRYVVTAWNAEGNVVVSQAAATKTLTPIASISFDSVPADTKFLGPNEIIMGNDVQVGDPVQGVRIYDAYSGSGGAVYLYEEDGSTTQARIEPDLSGEGGYLYVDGSSASGSYIRLQGMGSNSEADLTVAGTSDFYVYAGQTGDGSVVMPADAIGSAEMFDEPGVANAYSNSSITASSDPDSILTRTISYPADGYVFAFAWADVFFNHSNGTTSWLNCSINNEGFNVMDYDQNAQAGVSMNAPSGSYYATISTSRIMPVTGTSTQFHYVCDTSTTANVTIRDRHLGLLYVPTAYGSVSVPAKSTGPSAGDNDATIEMQPASIPASSYGPQTAEDFEAERLESIQANLDRIQAELDEIAAQNAAAQVDDPNQ